jgi:RES domain-containing protein
MEVFVHLAAGVVPPNHVLIRIDVPDDIAAAAEAVTSPPSDWQRMPVPSSTRDLGTSWARSNRSVLLRVPSVVIPAEPNFLINPQHPDFGRISAQVDGEFKFDPRMIANRS